MKKLLFVLFASLSFAACNEDLTDHPHDTQGGIMGPKGEQGPKGDKGETGPKGEPGANGEDGQSGTNGIDGAAGAKGDKGDKGDAGLISWFDSSETPKAAGFSGDIEFDAYGQIQTKPVFVDSNKLWWLLDPVEAKVQGFAQIELWFANLGDCEDFAKDVVFEESVNYNDKVLAFSKIKSFYVTSNMPGFAFEMANLKPGTAPVSVYFKVLPGTKITRVFQPDETPARLVLDGDGASSCIAQNMAEIDSEVCAGTFKEIFNCKNAFIGNEYLELVDAPVLNLTAPLSPKLNQ